MKTINLCDSSHPEVVLPLCEKYNLGIEIQGFCNTNETHEANEKIAYYKSLLPENINKYLHAPFWDLRPGSINKKVVEITSYYFSYAYDISMQLDCLGIIAHNGYVPNTAPPHAWTRNAGVFWRDFFLAHNDIDIFLENTLERSTSMLKKVIKKSKSTRLGVNLDVGHANAFGVQPVLQWIEKLGDNIRYVHLNQNNGEYDEHLGLTKGNMDMKEILKCLETHAPQAIWAVECKLDDMEESVLFLRDCGYL